MIMSKTLKARYLIETFYDLEEDWKDIFEKDSVAEQIKAIT
jgi:hypothetical protein